MAAITPTFNVTLTGENILTALDKVITWNTGEKLEQDYVVAAADGKIQLNYSYINNIALMIFTASSSFIVTLTIGTNVISYEVNNIFIMDPTSTFLDTVDKIEISTIQTTGITISARIYGSAA